MLWQVWWGLKDIKVWLAALAIGANCVDVAAFTSFIPTFIHQFGFSPRKLAPSSLYICLDEQVLTDACPI